MKVSVIIPTKNRPGNIRECVNSLLGQTYPINELIIVDGSDDDRTEHYVRSCLKDRATFNCVYVRQKAGGMAHARNIGLENANNAIISFLDDDVILDKNYLNEIVSIFIEDEEGKIGGVGGKAVERGESRLSNIFYFVFGLVFLRDSFNKGSVTIAGHHAALPDKPSFVKWLDGKSMAYRKSVLSEFRDDEQLERLGAYAFYEDLDLSYSVSKKYLLFINTNARLIHNHSPSRPDPFKINNIKIQNHYYLIKKHQFNRIAFWWSTIGLVLAYLFYCIVRPSRSNYLAAHGLFNGILEIINGRTSG